MWKTVLFDLDGTLTDSAPGITNAVAYALARYGVREDPKDLTRFVGPPLTDSFRDYYGFDLDKRTEAVGFFREYYNEKGWLENFPYPGIEDFLRDLKEAGLTLLVATSKPEAIAVRILDHFGLAGYFDHIAGAPLGSEEGSRKSAVIRSALDRLGDPAGAVMVGDRRHDVAGARETGLPCIGVLYGYGDREELEEAGADFIAEDLAGLKGLLLRNRYNEEEHMEHISKRIAKDLLKIKAVFFRPEEPFTWASGIKSPVYCDNRLTLTAPEVRNDVENALAETVKREYPDAEVLMGTSTAGIAHAAITGHILGLPMGYVRSGSKDHGRKNQIEGKLEQGQKVVVVEDLISTGGSVIEVVSVLREAGAEVLGVVSIFTYGMQKGIERLAAADVKNVSLTNFDVVAQAAADEGYIKPEDIARLIAFRDNPADESWIGGNK